MNYNRKLILQNGEEYYGCSFGDQNDKIVELVFNAPASYDEVLSDPTFADQGVVMTFPQFPSDQTPCEFKAPTVGAMIVRNYNSYPSNIQTISALEEMMRSHHIPGITGVDIMRLARTIRSGGSQRALITSVDTPLKAGLRALAKSRSAVRA